MTKSEPFRAFTFSLEFGVVCAIVHIFKHEYFGFSASTSIDPCGFAKGAEAYISRPTFPKPQPSAAVFYLTVARG